MTTTTDYVLARTPEEYERLRLQARMFEPETARLLERARIGPGTRCLDAGCGPGETMRLMAERGGDVTGVDVDATLGGQAVDRLAAAGHRCTFAAIDVTTQAPPGAPFDVVFARALLIHVDEPAAVLRRLWDWVAPGGTLIVQDYDLLTHAVVPELELVERFRRVAVGVFERSGRDVRVGLRLPALYADADIGAPDGLEAAVRVAPLTALAPMYEGVYRSVLPAALELGLTTPEEGEAWLAAFPAAASDRHAALWPPLIGTWKEKP
jgi:SAM-dependent methyltransferase